MRPDSNSGSGFRFYSIGIVVEDKTDDGNFIKVTPSEELPLLPSGRLSDAKFDYKSSGTDHLGVGVNTNIKGVGYVVADWVAFESGNRNTAPNVYEGEHVMLVKFGGSDKVFWIDMYREPSLRRLENVVYSFSNLPKKGEAYDQDSSYWFQVSTRDKVIQLHTSDNDGEAVKYDFTLDTDKGTFTLQDSNQNEIFLDSVNGDLRVNLNRSIELNAPMIRFNGETYVRTTAPEITEKGDNITNDSSSTIIYKSGGTLNAESSAATEIKAGGSMDIEASSNLTAKSGANLTTDAGGTNTVKGSSVAIV